MGLHLATVASWSEYQGDRSAAAWFPDRATAYVWRAWCSKFPPVQLNAKTTDGSAKLTVYKKRSGISMYPAAGKDIELGVYACNMFGGNTNMENFSFSSAYAYMIRDGEVAEMVKDVILAGNLFTTLKNIDAIGDDFEWIDTAGGCGKGGQNGLPVSFGSAHIRIQDVIIGGE